METITANPGVLLLLVGPHSLGTLIEWKLDFLTTFFTRNPVGSPHSLGTLIEWKLLVRFYIGCVNLWSPLAGDIN